MSLLINEDFRSRSRHAKKITTGIYLIFRGLFFEHNGGHPTVYEGEKFAVEVLPRPAVTAFARGDFALLPA